MATFRLTGLGLMSASLVLSLAAGCGDKDSTGDDSTTGDDSSVQDDDLDDDGLTNAEEEELGTDPEEADTDDDGCDDKDEIDEGHDPLDEDDDCEVFEDYLFLYEVVGAFDGTGLYGYSGESSGQPFEQEYPFVTITIVTEDYLDTGDDRYLCEWVGEIVSEDDWTPNDFGVSDLWIGYEVKFQAAYYEDGTQINTCTDMDPAVWGEVTPTTVIEATTWTIGYAPASSDMLSGLEESVTGQGGDWETDWAPYTFAFWGGFYAGSELAFNEMGYASGIEVDESFAIVLDEAGDQVARPLGEGATELTPYTLLFNGWWSGYYTYGITGQ